MQAQPQLSRKYKRRDDEAGIREDILQAAAIELFRRLRNFDPAKGPLSGFVDHFAGQIFATVIPSVRKSHFGAPSGNARRAKGGYDYTARPTRGSAAERVDLEDFVRSFPLLEREAVFAALSGEPVQESCRRIGIKPRTYYRHLASARAKIRQLFGRG